MYITLDSLQALRTKLRAALPDDLQLTIAGGAVRDLLLGRQVKDIDIFIQGESLEDEGYVGHLADTLGHLLAPHNGLIDADKRSSRPGSCPDLPHHLRRKFIDKLGAEFELAPEGYPPSLIQSVWAVRGWPEYQLIMMADADTPVVEQFDFTICQAWIDESGVRTTPAFRRDRLEKVLRFIPTARWSADHAARLAAKFPQWKRVGWKALA